MFDVRHEVKTAPAYLLPYQSSCEKNLRKPIPQKNSNRQYIISPLYQIRVVGFKKNFSIFTKGSCKVSSARFVQARKSFLRNVLQVFASRDLSKPAAGTAISTFYIFTGPNFCRRKYRTCTSCDERHGRLGHSASADLICAIVTPKVAWATALRSASGP